MTSLLLTISLLLHLFTFMWILVLIQKIKAQGPTDHSKVKAEIEDLLIAYTEEMKDENKKLVKELQQLKKERQVTMKEDRSEEIKNTAGEKLQAKAIINRYNPYKNIKQEHKDKEKYEVFQPPLEASGENSSALYEQSDSVKVIALSKQGIPADQIAKKLGLGKGEVELMIKFHQ